MISPEAAIQKYIEDFWEGGSPDEKPLNIVRRTLLAGLRDHPGNKDLLLEIAIFHEVVSEEWELAERFFRQVDDILNNEYVYYFARCLACLRRNDEAIALIDSYPLPPDKELSNLRNEILDNEWSEYGANIGKEC